MDNHSKLWMNFEIMDIFLRFGWERVVLDEMKIKRNF